jgi:hypothetical protein
MKRIGTVGFSTLSAIVGYIALDLSGVLLWRYNISKATVQATHEPTPTPFRFTSVAIMWMVLLFYWT